MAAWRLRRAGAALAASSAVAVALAASSASASDPSAAALDAARQRVAQPGAAPPPRDAQRAALAGSTPAEPLDVLVVGGGATGCGAALDAATRGLRVGLVEREDFSSGTSSRSTKLIHGGKEFETFAKVVINAAGPFCDSVRKMANNDVVPMICPSSGVHIVLPDYYSPEGMGLIVPKTKDGRVVFMLPWLGRTVAGTTDSSTAITMLPEPHEDEIQFILDAISDYLNVQVRRSDVLSAWSGIRPLAMDPSAKNTESISRDHVVFEDYPGLITITGGKWTTYRSMAEDAVNAAVRSGNLKPANSCVTDNLQIVGGYGWDPASFTVLAQNYKRMKKTYGGKVIPGAMDSAVSKHLSHAYGTLAEQVASIAQNEGLGKRLAHGYPFLEAEVAYCARHEYCESAVDFVARRCRLAFLDTDAAGRALPRIVDILASEHKWDKARKKVELQKGREFLETFKSSKNAQFSDGKHNGR
ncbi:glycerol-3-phosphate dehydrogenase SDP6, mitochondrial isoform X3 [Panicum virgatum]|uniref:glycerol-3-phosphate dehydrogenase SDP6, mitochondrial isoform X3 n=1 Tax=Panicum virgatum TaxID=38727 RepID=UPI0019D6A1D7|nr:glycerol-3-phosphate dehydrogenase SDP6, mitochondrial isoform X3 [Panicum virgatum]